MTRIPDIYLTPKELDQRAAKIVDDATAMSAGRARDKALKSARQDHDMAVLMRYAGYSDDEGPSSRRIP
jgi:N-acetylmuramic acid 6-phosphate (MurNAc-6-P) etherase